MIKVWPAFLVMLLAGCDLVGAIASRQAITRAEFSFKTAEITNLDVPLLVQNPGADLKVTLGVKNPNPIALLDKLDYQVTLQGQPVATGFLGEEFKVEPGASRDLILPISVKYSALPDPIVDALLKREVAVAIKGASHLSTPFGTLDFPMEVGGRTAI
ncbi:MAG: LEA type 2 family protein [Candidatus Sericytochromatia bacterium]|uniref:LEA type 2 family protein n=1 Tax=Candidatus Tanganyikabacteria bacterium TaxID=2961651 RepID=A0A937X4U1_9BACT|nr:LEA type 2 family protein [Candidatus Tanganyikabacteria bacterium]